MVEDGGGRRGTAGDGRKKRKTTENSGRRRGTAGDDGDDTISSVRPRPGSGRTDCPVANTGHRLPMPSSSLENEVSYSKAAKLEVTAETSQRKVLAEIKDK